MARDYKILAPENCQWMFVDANSYYPPGYISYRHVIAHNLHHLIWELKLDSQSIGPLMLSFKHAWDNKDNINNPLFMDSHVSDGNVTIVDHSKGCYPLCLDHESRIIAFNHALNDIYKKMMDIIHLLSIYDAWTPEVQNKLEDLYSMP